ncbi:uncharacterized protein Dsimw501_GD26812 [Drosophila simulans]|nr:uncharacterized protein Dsimw501_GD26812 [Drosophila simulans]
MRLNRSARDRCVTKSSETSSPIGKTQPEENCLVVERGTIALHISNCIRPAAGSPACADWGELHRSTRNATLYQVIRSSNITPASAELDCMSDRACF